MAVELTGFCNYGNCGIARNRDLGAVWLGFAYCTRIMLWVFNHTNGRNHSIRLFEIRGAIFFGIATIL